MPEKTRQLAAIMFTDIVGYSALAQKNEDLSIELLEEHRDLLRPLFPRFRGREVETIGDAFFLEFSSVLEAVKCAIEIQNILNNRNASEPAERKIILRIGIHLGDVTHIGEKVHGDGVNIAARIQTLARPGGICISDQLYAQVRNKLEMQWISRGEQKLKNIDSPVEVYDVVLPWEKAAETADESTTKWVKKINRWKILFGTGVVLVILSLYLIPPKVTIDMVEKETPVQEEDIVQEVVVPVVRVKSIAVLLFDNLSDDPSNAFFARGIHEDILINLSKIRSLKVISRTSVIRYGENPPNLREIGEELGVNYIVEGSVRRFGNRVRVSAQLIDAHTDEHLWAANFDRELTDVFAIQSAIASEVTKQLHAELSPKEAARIRNVPTTSVEAYDLYLQARELFRNIGQTLLGNCFESITLLENAVKEDPEFAHAWAQLAKVHSRIVHAETTGENTDLDEAVHRDKAGKALDKAHAVAPEDPMTYIASAYFHYWGNMEYEEALEDLARAGKLLPSSAEILALEGYVLRRMGRGNLAIAKLGKAFNLDPKNTRLLFNLIISYELAGRPNDAARLSKNLIVLEPDYPRGKNSQFYNEFYATGRFKNLENYERLIQELPEERIRNKTRELMWLAQLRNDIDALVQAIESFSTFKSTEERFYYSEILPILTVALHAQGKQSEAEDIARKIVEYVQNHLHEFEFEISESHFIDFWILSAAAIAHAILNEKEQARNYLEQLKSFVAREKDAWYGLLLRLSVIRATAWIDPDEAASLVLDELKAEMSRVHLYQIAAEHWQCRPILLQPRIKELIIEDGKWLDYLSERVPEYADLKSP